MDEADERAADPALLRADAGEIAPEARPRGEERVLAPRLESSRGLETLGGGRLVRENAALGEPGVEIFAQLQILPHTQEGEESLAPAWREGLEAIGKLPGKIVASPGVAGRAAQEIEEEELRRPQPAIERRRLRRRAPFARQRIARRASMHETPAGCGLDEKTQAEEIRSLGDEVAPI